MKKALSIVLIILALLSCLSGCGAEKKEKFNAYYFDYFDTATTITGYCDSKEEFDSICLEIKDMLQEYHRLFTIYNRYDGINNLVTVNDVKKGSHSVVKVDRKIIDLLLFAKEMHKKTYGIVNIAMGSVLKIWHNYRAWGLDNPQKAELPPMEKLRQAAQHTDINDIIIDEENSTVFLADGEMSLDVGAIAKGYAVERIAEALEEKGVTSFIINVGGNIRTIGLNGENEPFKAGIENPDTADEDTPYIEFLYLTDQALVTSGNYQRFYTVDGKSYHHIIDPETLMPGTNYRSVSILTNDSALGDALSTALFLMDYERGVALIESIPGSEAMWVLNDGTQLYSSGFEDYTFEYEGK